MESPIAFGLRMTYSTVSWHESVYVSVTKQLLKMDDAFVGDIFFSEMNQLVHSSVTSVLLILVSNLSACVSYLWIYLTQGGINQTFNVIFTGEGPAPWPTPW